jgi:hypothetical protein
MPMKAMDYTCETGLSKCYIAVKTIASIERSQRPSLGNATAEYTLRARITVEHAKGVPVIQTLPQISSSIKNEKMRFLNASGVADAIS